jgi:hypothetical protein
LCGDAGAFDRGKAVANIGIDDDTAHDYILAGTTEDSTCRAGVYNR